MIHFNEYGMKCLKVDSVLETEKDPRSYKCLLLIKTKCGKHYIGIQRGDEWLVKADPKELGNDTYTELPKGEEVKGWVLLD